MNTQVDPPAAGFKAFVAATSLVVGTYAYFLIFPQFAFLHSLASDGLDTAAVRMIMAAMAAGGISGGLACGYLWRHAHARTWICIAVSTCSFPAAIFALLPKNYPLHWTVGALSGIGLGLLTVSVTALLPALKDPRRILMACGTGTGLAYAFCNIPAVFNATPSEQALMALALLPACALPLAAWRPERTSPQASGQSQQMRPGISRRRLVFGIALFLLLVWLDSACFAIIQDNDVMRKATWGRDADLVANAAVHLAMALVTGLYATQRSIRFWLGGALTSLAAAAFLLEAGGRAATWAHLPYAAGVSVYSTLLVAWLPLHGGVFVSRNAAFLYAIAGWAGSALGIGMAQDLSQIPVAFVVTALALFVAGLIVLTRLERTGER